MCFTRCLREFLENYQRGLPIAVVWKFHKPHLYGRELRIRLLLYYIYIHINQLQLKHAFCDVVQIIISS